MGFHKTAKGSTIHFLLKQVLYLIIKRRKNKYLLFIYYFSVH